MEEYIKLSDVLNILNACRCSDCTNDKPQSCQLCQFQDFYNRLMKDTPTIKHNVGKWISASTKPGVHAGMKCSLCKARISYSEHFNGQHLYCHKCGAKMIKE
jgi:hypothetical protein